MKETLIEDYVSFFHDGSVICIEHDKNNIEIAMQSAQVDVEDVREGVLLSRYNRIKGKLHLIDIEAITINDVPFFDKLQMSCDKGNIFDFFLEKNAIELQMELVNFPPKKEINEFLIIKIKARRIWWENIPDLFDPFW